jgi:pyroglutamyl-peptidase
MEEMRLLLTGFEPFGQWTVNPSALVASALDGERFGDVRVMARQLPVNWEETWPLLLTAIKEVEPRWVLMLGLADKRSHISVESRGWNGCGELADNQGKLPQSPAIRDGGDEFLYATLPVDEIVAAIQALGLPVEKSEDAGRYLCNHSLYSVLRWAATGRGRQIQVGFIHLPNLPGQSEATAGMALEEMIAAVRAAITTIVQAVGVESTR